MNAREALTHMEKAVRNPYLAPGQHYVPALDTLQKCVKALELLVQDGEAGIFDSESGYYCLYCYYSSDDHEENPEHEVNCPILQARNALKGE